MSALKATRSAQKVSVADFVFNFDDTMENTSGVSTDFKSVAAAVFEAINLPQGAVVVGGEVVVDTAYATSATATLSVGDSSSATRYASAVDIKSAARTALTLTGFRTTGLNIRLTVTCATAASTAGKVSVRVLYVIEGRADEVVSA